MREITPCDDTRYEILTSPSPLVVQCTATEELCAMTHAYVFYKDKENGIRIGSRDSQDLEGDVIALLKFYRLTASLHRRMKFALAEQHPTLSISLQR